jgi:hypothetical protein
MPIPPIGTLSGSRTGCLRRREGLARHFRHALTRSTRACLRSSLTSAGCADSRSARLSKPPRRREPTSDVSCPLVLSGCPNLAFFSIALPDSMLGVAWPAMRISFQQPISSAGLVPPLGVAATLISTASSGYLLYRIGLGGFSPRAHFCLPLHCVFRASAFPRWDSEPAARHLKRGELGISRHRQVGRTGWWVSLSGDIADRAACACSRS